MAINIVKFREKEAYGVYEFLCDFDSDVKDLRTDCAPGSKAYVVESGKNYVFNSLKQWKEVEGSGGSSGSGAGTTITSGVVNQDGTITFADSNGNTFTTSGSSIIGVDGIGIADVHIDGDGDLIVETTDGHMENVGHVVGVNGQNYILTTQDKSDIANIVLDKLPTAEGVLYGNTNN